MNFYVCLRCVFLCVGVCLYVFIYVGVCVGMQASVLVIGANLLTVLWCQMCMGN